MAAKKKGPGKGRGPATRPPSPAKRTTIPKQATAKPPADAASKGPERTPGQPPPAAPAGSAGQPPTTAARAPGGPAPSQPPSKAGAQPSKPGAQPSKAGPQPSKAGPQSAKPGSQTAKGGAPPAKAGQPPTPSGKATGKGAAQSVKAGVPAAKGGGQAGKTGAKPAKGSAAKAPSAKGGAASGKGSAATPTSAPPGKGRPRGGPTREERMAAAAAERRRQSIRNKALVAAGVVAVLFVVSFVLVSDRRERAKEAAAFQTDSCTFDRQTDADAGSGRNHVPNPTYDVDPPAGGDHTVEAAGPGVFTADKLPLDGQVVHALEHGFIVLWHRPDLDEQSLTAVREVAQKHPGEVLMVPRATLDPPVAATAWHERLLCGKVEVDTLERFVDTFVDKGPEKGYVSRDGG